MYNTLTFRGISVKKGGGSGDWEGQVSKKGKKGSYFLDGFFAEMVSFSSFFLANSIKFMGFR
jgi:hypothetical protein